MAFGGKVDDEVRVGASHKFRHGLTVADVGFDKFDIRTGYFVGDGGEVTGIGKGVDNSQRDIIAIFAKEIFHKIGADETGTACNEIFIRTSGHAVMKNALCDSFFKGTQKKQKWSCF